MFGIDVWVWLEKETMRRYEISDKQWDAIKGRLPCQAGYKGKSVNNRLFINAIMYVAKCGIPWRDLPERFGNWNTVYVRFRRWAKAGVWQRILKELTDKEFKAVLIDSTIVRVHRHGAGALKKQGWKQPGHRQIKRRPDNQGSFEHRWKWEDQTHSAYGWTGFRYKSSFRPSTRNETAHSNSR